MSKIDRVLSPGQLALVQKHLGFLTKRVSESHGELDLQLRKDYFNIYYKGNSLAHITPVPTKGLFQIKVDEAFKLRDIICGLDDSRLRPDELFGTVGSKHNVAIVPTSLIHPFLQKKVVDALMSAIKKRGFSEEITFEQSLITDNLNRRDLIIIDRQVQPKGADDREKMDLLGLRLQANARYRFVVFEVKLGCNKELSGPVAAQLDRYTKLVTRNFDDFASCYQTNYEQKRTLGVLGTVDWPNSIAIEAPVEGRIVVGMYSGYGDWQIREKLLVAHPDLEGSIQKCWYKLD